MNLFSALLDRHRQFILYALIGATGVTIDIVTYFITTKYLGWGVLAANFVSITLGIINNFFLNLRFNFRVTDKLLERFWIFYGVGFIGLGLSELLLAVFHYALGLDGLTAKGLTLLPVLLFQFVLNRRFSFGNLKESREKIGRLFFHHPLYMLLVLYALLSLILIKAIPADFSRSDPRNAPDEAIHYNFNVAFIKDNRSLPVSGRDDLSAYSACREDSPSLVACVYSYNVFPPPSYIVNAIFAGLAESTNLLKPEVASRMLSFLSGLIFVIFTYATSFSILRSRWWAIVVSGSVVLIPQVVFTNSYTNLDSHSLALSSMSGFFLVQFLKYPKEKKWKIACAVTVFGLLPLAKYNYLFLIPLTALLVVLRLRYSNAQKADYLMMLYYSLTSFILLSGYWYTRNALLYGDPFGQSFVVKTMSEVGRIGSEIPMNASGLIWFFHDNFFSKLFNSFFFAFGGMNYFLSSPVYTALSLLLVLATIMSIYLAATASRESANKLLIIIGSWFGVLAISVAQVVINAIKFDPQPQGRYLYPIIVPLVIAISYAQTLDKRFRIIALLLLVGTVFLLTNSFGEFVKAYYPRG